MSSNNINNEFSDLYNVPNKGIMQGLQSPLQDEFKDGDYNNVKLIIDYVPFMDCGDATLRILRELGQLSPTQAACINSKIDYATGGGLGFIKQIDNVFKRQSNKEAVISDAEHNAYADFLASVIDVDTLLSKIQKQGKNQLTYGNSVLEIVLTDTVGYRGGAINVYDAAMFRYKRENEKVVTSRAYLSQRWDYWYISRNKHEVVEYAMYPAFKEHEDGTLRSLIHVKDEALYRNWYGLPTSFSSIYFQFMEYQLGKYTTRGYENFWLPAAFIETYDMPMETDPERAAEEARALVNQLANVYTNRGDGKKLPVVFRAAPAGSQPSTITQFNPQTHENFHTAMKEVAQSQILKSHGWHTSLLEKTVGSIGNNSENADLAMITDKTVIKPLQGKMLYPFQIAIKEIEKWVGYDNTAGLTIDLKSVFETPAMPELPTIQNTITATI
jgi:hypothetical protein